MNYRNLGKAGIKVSELSFGAWVTFGNQLDYEVAKACFTAAHEEGVNFFDNAEAYADGQAEVVMGKVIRDLGLRREQLVISTKIFWGGSGPNDVGLSHKHIVEGLNNALRRLQMEYVDLVFCHRPDPSTPIEETVRAMDVVIKQGKAFYWGTSEWSAAEIMRADTIARQYNLTPPSMEQPQYNLFTRERVEKEYLPLYRDLGYGTTIFSPLASGQLTGKYLNGIPQNSRGSLEGYDWLKSQLTDEERNNKIRQLGNVAQDLGCTLSQLALAWCLCNPRVSTVITGASRPEQVKENMQALKTVPSLNTDVVQAIEEIMQNNPNE